MSITDLVFRILRTIYLLAGQISGYTGQQRKRSFPSGFIGNLEFTWIPGRTLFARHDDEINVKNWLPKDQAVSQLSGNRYTALRIQNNNRGQ